MGADEEVEVEEEVEEVEEEYMAMDFLYQHNVNQKVSADVTDADLLLFMYVVHETSKMAEEAEFSFYKGIAKRAQEGAIVVICDVMQRSRSDINKVIEAIRSIREIVVLDEKKAGDVVRYTTECTVLSF